MYRVVYILCFLLKLINKFIHAIRFQISLFAGHTKPIMAVQSMVVIISDRHGNHWKPDPNTQQWPEIIMHSSVLWSEIIIAFPSVRM